MKQYLFAMRLIVIKIFLFFTLNIFGQCNGTQTFTLNPSPPVGGYLPGTVVNVCYTMNGYSQSGSNWIEGFDLTLGNGWTNLTPTTPPANCGGNNSGGQWVWFPTTTNTPVGNVGPGYFFDLDSDGQTGDDFGDSGSCVWTFCFTVTVSNVCSPQNLLIQVTAGPDGLWGSWNSTSCDLVSPFTVYNGNSNPILPSIGQINHN